MIINILPLTRPQSSLKRFPVVLLFIFTAPVVQSQHLLHQFGKLSRAEKHWVYHHPLVARKAYRITREVLDMTQTELHDSLLDGKANGGQVDAFRHAFWMARLANGIGTRKARKLGLAHEKGNYQDFCKGRTEEGALSDSIASAMDLQNNRTGLELFKQHPRAGKEEMRAIVIDAIIRGKLCILLMDYKSNYYDCSGNRIDPDAWKGKWNIPKCLVGSNTRHL
jgi:hypothetical protein